MPQKPKKYNRRKMTRSVRTPEWGKVIDWETAPRIKTIKNVGKTNWPTKGMLTKAAKDSNKTQRKLMAQMPNRNKKVSGKQVSQSGVMFRTILRNGVHVLVAPLIMIRKASYIMLLLLVTGLTITALLSPAQTISHLALLLASLTLIILNLWQLSVMIGVGSTHRSTTTESQTLRQRFKKHSERLRTKH